MDGKEIGFFLIGVFTGLISAFVLIPYSLSINGFVDMWVSLAISSMFALLFGLILVFQKKQRPERFHRIRRLKV